MYIQTILAILKVFFRISFVVLPILGLFLKILFIMVLTILDIDLVNEIFTMTDRLLF